MGHSGVKKTGAGRLLADRGLTPPTLSCQTASLAPQGAHFIGAHPGSRCHGPVTPGRSAQHLAAFDPEIGPGPLGGRAGLEKGAIK